MKATFFAACLLVVGLRLVHVDGRPVDRVAASPCPSITADNIDDCVRLNQIQVVGTHNSYHVAPKPPVLELSLPKTRPARIPNGGELSQGRAVRLDATRTGWSSHAGGRRREYCASFGGVGDRRVARAGWVPGGQSVRPRSVRSGDEGHRSAGSRRRGHLLGRRSDDEGARPCSATDASGSGCSRNNTASSLAGARRR
jgi:hypothetical protein